MGRSPGDGQSPGTSADGSEAAPHPAAPSAAPTPEAALGGFDLLLPPSPPSPGLLPLAASLRAQATALGARHRTGLPSATASDSVELRLRGPHVDVHCSVTGWPAPATGPISETVAQAVCGLMSVHGRAAGGASPIGVDYVSTVTAALAVQGMTAAALGQLRGRRTARVRLSAAGAALLTTGQYLAGATAPEDPERLLPGHGDPAARPPFRSADGVVFELEALDAVPWREFWTGLGAPGEAVAAGWQPFLLRYARAVCPLPAALHRVLRSLPFDRIAETAARTGMSVCVARPLSQRATDPDVADLLAHGPWRLRPLAPAPRDRLLPPPADSDDSLPLHGLRVVESCRRIQGPLAGHLLRLLGAEVVRIEPVGGDPLRGMPPMAGDRSARFDALNNGKEVREINLKTNAGREQVRELVRDSDVFLHNWAPGKAAALGLDDTDLTAVNPGLVYAHASGWGEALGDAPPLGTDFMVQAHSGVADALTGPGQPARGSLMTLLDVLGGVVAAQGVVLGLLARQRRGSGQRVDTSLLGAATLLLADRLGSAAPVPGVDGVFPTARGLLALTAADASALRRLSRAVDADLGGAADAFRRELLGKALLTRDARSWQHSLSAAGIPAGEVAVDLSALRDDPRCAPALIDADYTMVDSPWRFM